MVPIERRLPPRPAVPKMVTYPVVADPESYAINRLQLVNTSLPGTTLTLGRQRILLDDQRFVGNVGWRQNEQTFDAFRVVNKSVKNLVLDATYLNRVNRVFGEDSPQGTYKGDSVLLNAGYQTKIGKITGVRLSTGFDTHRGRARRGARFHVHLWAAFRRRSSGGQAQAGLRRVLGHANRLRRQPADLRPRLHAPREFTATYRQFGLGAGIEVLEGNGVKGFTTPLATLHKFQGWADKFLTTPAERHRRPYADAEHQSEGGRRARHAGAGA